MTNRFDRRTLKCPCKSTDSRKFQYFTHESQNAVCVFRIPKENEPEISIQIIDMTPESEFKKEDLKQKDVKEKESIPKELKDDELIGKELRDDELENNEMKNSKVREQKLDKSGQQSKELRTQEVKEKEARVTFSIEEQKRPSNVIPPLLQDSSVQTIESEKCCESLAEKMFEMLQTLEDQSRIRREVASGSDFPIFEPDFLTMESQDVQTDYLDRTFPNLEPKGVQSNEASRNLPVTNNSTDTVNLDRTTSGYSSSSHKTWISPERLLQPLEEERNCFCCGSDRSSKTGKSSSSFEKSGKMLKEKNNIERKKKKDNSPDLSITGPEFVQMLLEIGEYTRNLERQLAKMNKSMKNCNKSSVTRRRNDLEEEPNNYERNTLFANRTSEEEFRNFGSNEQKRETNTSREGEKIFFFQKICIV